MTSTNTGILAVFRLLLVSVFNNSFTFLITSEENEVSRIITSSPFSFCYYTVVKIVMIAKIQYIKLEKLLPKRFCLCDRYPSLNARQKIPKLPSVLYLKEKPYYIFYTILEAFWKR